MRFTALLLAAFVALPSPAGAWGFEAHKFIADRMIALLPPELKPLFEKRRDFIVERAIDPDLWRNVGWEEEPPNHFLDFDFEAFGPYPFTALPREYDAAVQKFGKAVITEQGTLPWRTAEFYGRLQREFASLKRQPVPGYAVDNIVLYSAILAHYVADGHVPLHGVVNYDGQLTGQQGLHSRWEAELFERNRVEAESGAPGAQTDSQSARLHVRDAARQQSRRGQRARIGQESRRRPRVLRRCLLRGVRGRNLAGNGAAIE